MSSPVVSVIVPTFQRCDSVRRLLEALCRQSLDAFEVVVVMDGSTDATQGVVRQYESRLRIKALWQSNSGRAAACNAGLQAASASIVLILDDDMEPSSKLVEEHWAAHAAEPNLGVVGAAPIRLAERAGPAARFVAQKFADHLAQLERRRELTDARQFYSGNFSIPRVTLVRAGAFDEGFRLYGNEDVELSIRLRSAGVRLLFRPTALAFQHYEKTGRQLARDSFFKGRTAVMLLEKHPHMRPSHRLGRLATLSRWQRMLAWLGGVTAVNAVVRGTLCHACGVVEAVRLPGSATFYRRATNVLFWLGALSEIRRRGG